MSDKYLNYKSVGTWADYNSVTGDGTIGLEAFAFANNLCTYNYIELVCNNNHRVLVNMTDIQTL